MKQQEMPLITAVIPVYNHDRYVIESIRSIIGQSYRNIELIVINDGSKDQSHERILTLVEECKRRFVRFEYINRENKGVCATLNQALKMSKGKYFSALASDDVALPGKFSLLVGTLESVDNSYAAAFGNALMIDDQSRPIWLGDNGLISHEKAANASDNYLDFRTERGRIVDYRKAVEFGSFATLLAHNYLPAMSNLVRTDLIRLVGDWTEGNISEDWEMWRKLSKRYKFLYIDEPVALYRWHENNSVKIISDKLKLSSLLLLTKEKSFCAENGLVPYWRNAYLSLLGPVLFDGRIPLREKISALDVSEISSISLYVTRRLAQKTLKVLRGRESV